ncbi:hypothetical protein [Streptomyces sp. NPDC040750]
MSVTDCPTADGSGTEVMVVTVAARATRWDVDPADGAKPVPEVAG